MIYLSIGTAVLAVLLAGYFAQKYLPPPPPKLVGIDLGTTYSCVGIYHAVSGAVEILQDGEGHMCIPSVVAFRDGKVLVGYEAVSQAEHNPGNTIYDAKRFIGKPFTKPELQAEQQRYPFKMSLDKHNMVQLHVLQDNNLTLVTPEYIGSCILDRLQQIAEHNLSMPVTRAIISVPAEFNQRQRNYTRLAAKLAGLDIWRVINEPTAAALAYGLHKKESTSNVVVVDLGGGTLDVSLLYIQGGMFLTQAMAGNNHLGGQDFNVRLLNHLIEIIKTKYHTQLTDAEDLQNLRDLVEKTKLELTYQPSVSVELTLKSLRSTESIENVTFRYNVTRDLFETLNQDLLKKVLEPIALVLQATELLPSDIDEIVLVGGSTRIPKVREMVASYFNKIPNTAIDPELAVVSGVSIQAGILGGAWPLQVSAIEVPSSVEKIHLS